MLELEKRTLVDARLCCTRAQCVRAYILYHTIYPVALITEGSSADGCGSDPGEGVDWSPPRGGWTHPRFGGQKSATTMMEET